jgi:hypothetical protein
MNKLTTLYLTIFLTSCGGGGSLGTTMLETNSIPPTTPPTNTSLPEGGMSGKVIDGYIDGATVIFDLNSNGVLDDGEPYTVTGSDGDWSFDQYDLADFYDLPYDAIQANAYFESNFGVKTREMLICIEDTIKVAEVPVGAYDSDRGYVNESYTLYMIPQGSTAYEAQFITPFTTILGNMIASENSQLTPYQGCSSEGESVRTNIRRNVSVFETELYTGTGLSLEDFYVDYIATGETDKQQIAERLTDVLIDIYKVKDAYVGTDYTKFQFIIETNSITTLLSTNPITDIGVQIEMSSEPVSNGEWESRYQKVWNVTINYVNDTIDSAPITLTELDNLSVTNEENYSYSVIQNTDVNLINSNTWTFNLKDYDGDYGTCSDWMRNEKMHDDMVRLELQDCTGENITTYFKSPYNTVNSYVKDDVVSVHEELSLLNRGMNNFESLILPSLGTGDSVNITKVVGNTIYSYNFTYSYEMCDVWVDGENTESTFGYDGYLNCLNYMQ